MVDRTLPSSVNRFRARRVETFSTLVNDYIAVKGSCRILDMGGTTGFWYTWRDAIDFTKTSITCVNPDVVHSRADFAEVELRQGDARDLADVADGEFDIAFSNSVIEHVGGWGDMKAFASEVGRVGRSYFVQTPYFWFPVEPHARTPLIHWLPESVGYRILLARSCGFWGRSVNVDEAMGHIQSARMLDITQFATLFPDAEIRKERFMGWVKSLLAVRHALS